MDVSHKAFTKGNLAITIKFFFICVHFSTAVSFPGNYPMDIFTHNNM